MSWTTPKIWAYKEAPLSNNFNTYIRDNNNYLKTLLDAMVPIGARWIWPTDVAPTGFLLCQGQAVSRSTYSALFAVIGTTYGVGDGSTTFNLPDAKGKVAVGKDSAQSEFDALGETGGAKTHTLSATEMPGHTHSGITGTISADHTHNCTTGGINQNHTHDIGGVWINDVSYTDELTGFADDSKCNTDTGGVSQDHSHSFTTGGVSDNHTHSFTTDGGTGGGDSHNNLMPYQVINFIIKY